MFLLKDLSSDVELRTRTEAQTSFVMWPLVVVPENADSKKDKKKPEKAKDKKPSALSLKVNKRLLLPLVGRSELHKKLGTIPFLEPLLKSLNDTWDVAQ